MRLLVSLLVALFASLTCLVKAHNIHVQPRARGIAFSPAELPVFYTKTNVVAECFFEELHKEDKMTVTFVTGPNGDANNDIDFWVCS